MLKIEVTNETEVYKKSSVILSGLFAFIAGVGPIIIESWALVPDSLRDALPEGVARWVAVLAFLLIIAGRYTHITKTQ